MRITGRRRGAVSDVREGPPFTKTLCDLDDYGCLMLTTESIQLVLEALILLLLLYLAFLKSYFQEKGRNVATKEDVEEITSLVESVKSQLQFSLQAKLSLRAEEHQALVAPPDAAAVISEQSP